MKRILVRYHDPYNFGFYRWTATMISDDGYRGRPFYVGSNKTTLDYLCNHLKDRQNENYNIRKRSQSSSR